jgi:hypothetical protein
VSNAACNAQSKGVQQSTQPPLTGWLLPHKLQFRAAHTSKQGNKGNNLPLPVCSVSTHLATHARAYAPPQFMLDADVPSTHDQPATALAAFKGCSQPIQYTLLPYHEFNWASRPPALAELLMVARCAPGTSAAHDAKAASQLVPLNFLKHESAPSLRLTSAYRSQVPSGQAARTHKHTHGVTSD